MHAFPISSSWIIVADWADDKYDVSTFIFGKEKSLKIAAYKAYLPFVNMTEYHLTLFHLMHLPLANYSLMETINIRWLDLDHSPVLEYQLWNKSKNKISFDHLNTIIVRF